MKVVFGKILIFVILIDLFYMSIGNFWVTQSEVHPPPKLVITVETPADELVESGEIMLRTKGGCLLCHKNEEVGNTRGPDLRGVGGRAANRKEGMSAEEYLIESLIAPSAYVVEEFKSTDGSGSSIMPASNKPPADLTATELKAVVAYLQSLGGEVTVKITEEDVAAATLQEAQSKKGPPASDHPGYDLMASQGCTTCHDIAGDKRLVGPPLTKVSQRLSPKLIRQSILDPSAVLVEGYGDLMNKDFAQKLTPQQVDQLVGYLSGEGASILTHPLLHLILLMLLFNGGMAVAIRLVSPPPVEAEFAWRAADPTTGLPVPSLTAKQVGVLLSVFAGAIGLTCVLYLIFRVSV